MKLEFKPDDFFCISYASDHEREMMAKAANAALERMLKVCPVVYGCNYPSSKGWGFDQQGILKETTHKAILVNIEPIEKAKCEHESAVIEYKNLDNIVCTKCHKKLRISKWEEVK